MTSKIVFDTSSLVSAAIRPKSIPARALQLAISHHQLSVSVDSLAEIERILNQDKFNKYNHFGVRKGVVAMEQTILFWSSLLPQMRMQS